MKIGAVEKSREGFDQGEGRHLHIRLLHLHIGLLRVGHHLHNELASPSVYHKGHRLNSLTPLREGCQKKLGRCKYRNTVQLEEGQKNTKRPCWLYLGTQVVTVLLDWCWSSNLGFYSSRHDCLPHIQFFFGFASESVFIQIFYSGQIFTYNEAKYCCHVSSPKQFLSKFQSFQLSWEREVFFGNLQFLKAVHKKSCSPCLMYGQYQGWSTLLSLFHIFQRLWCILKKICRFHIIVWSISTFWHFCS